MASAAPEDFVPPIRLGGMLFTIAQPEPGFERHFHRWYERDHFYAGCLIGPDFFSGRRWIATRPMREARFPAATPVTPDIRDGSFLATYWLPDAHFDRAMRWAVHQVLALHAQGRMEAPRRNICTGFYRYLGGAFRDADGVPPELALEHPFGQAVVAMLDAPDASEALAEWLVAGALAEALDSTGLAMALVFQPRQLPPDAPGNAPRLDPDALARRLLVLGFGEAHHGAEWDRFPRRLEMLVSAEGRGSLVYAAPFIPTVPGTDRYLDQL